MEPAETWGTTAVQEREGKRGRVIHGAVEKAAEDEHAI